ncbi:MAG: four helix bundle protein [Ignavibacteriales bacterium]|nr:four helix bundle protein [Ignavibacteriales bacterium]
MKIVRFEDLEVWKEGRKLTKKIYALTKNKKFSRDFSLVDQIRRAVVSITSNIAEGFDAQSNIEFIRFLKYSRRSVSEVKNQLYIALDEEYIEQIEFDEAYEMCSTVSKMLFGFMRYLKQPRKV